MSIKSKFASGTGWMALGATADYAMQFVVFIVLARFLTIRELGVVAFALVLMDIGRIFVNGGRSEIIVQRKDWDGDFSSVCFTRSLISAGVLALILAIPGAMLMDRYYQQGSGLPTAALSGIFMIEALRSIHAAKLRREFRFKALAGRVMVGTLVAGILAIILAISGWGLWAMVVQRLVQQTLSTVMTMRAAHWMPRFKMHAPGFPEAQPYMRRVTASRALDVANARAPDFLVGLILGPVAVALFRVGARALEVIVRTTVQPFQDAALSALSRLEDKEQIGRALARIVSMASLLMFPILIGAAVTADDLTIVLFGARYAPSAIIMATLALGILPSTLMLLAGTAYLAAGHAEVNLRINIASVSFLISGVVGGALLGGTYGSAIGVMAAQWLMMPITLYYLRSELGLSPAALLGPMAAPLTAALVMGMGVKLAATQVYGTIGTVPHLIALLIVGAGIYVAMLFLFGRSYLDGLMNEMRVILPAAIGNRLPRFR
ncbi:MAG: oligosaccharide flippase family protein [Sphingobium sp.]